LSAKFREIPVRKYFFCGEISYREISNPPYFARYAHIVSRSRNPQADTAMPYKAGYEEDMFIQVSCKSVLREPHLLELKHFSKAGPKFLFRLRIQAFQLITVFIKTSTFIEIPVSELIVHRKML
jgi:hypothetical protein